MARVRGAVAAVRRRWWLAALLVLLVAVGALAQYFGPGAAQRNTYIATRSLRIVLVPVGAATAYDGYAASRQEDEIARTLATGGLLGSKQLRSIIAHRLSQPGVHNIPAALSTTHAGNLVTFTVHGRSPAAADALATAVAEALDPTIVATLLPATLRPTSSEMLLVQAEGSASLPTRDTTQDAIAVLQILARIALAIVAGVLLTLLVDWMVRRSRAPRLA